MAKRYIQEHDRVYATGVFLRRYNGDWIVDGFEDDTYYDGDIVNDMDGTPFTGGDDNED